MRIVIDMQGAQTESRFRGIGRYTLAFAQAVARNRGDHEVYLALSGLFPDTVESIRAAFDGLLPQDNIRVWYAPGPVKDQQVGNEARREIAELIREAFLVSLKPDVIHIGSLFEGYIDDAVTSIGRFDSSTPVSVTLYDLIPLLNPDQYLTPNPSFERFYRRKIECLKRAELYLPISDFSRQEAISCLDTANEKIVSVSTAIEDHFSPQSIPKEAALQLYKKLGITREFVLYSGGADARKNLHRLLQAFAELPRDLRRAHQLVFAGNMSEEDVHTLKSRARSAGLRLDELIFTGFVTDEQLVKLYNLCTLFVLPSWHEGFGLPALEAMACGAPVIGANTTSLPEVIGLQEALFDPLDVSAISAKIAHALRDEAFRARLRDHGLRQVKKFSWDESAKRALTVWGRVTHTANRRPDGYLPRSIAYGRLLEALAEILVSAPESAWSAVARDLAKNQSTGLERQIFVDVSELCQRDAATGVQRVVRSFLNGLLDSPPVGFRVEPVFATVDCGYYYARRFTQRFLGEDESRALDQPVRWQRGDVFFGLDMQHHVQLAHAPFYRKLRSDGVVVKFMVYDLLPIQLAGLFADPAAQQLHEQWLAMIAAQDQAICISKATADAYEAWINTHGLTTSPSFCTGWVHMGADLDGSKPSTGLTADASATLRILQSRPTFLAVSTLEPRKAQTQILDAFEVLWARGHDLNLVFVGQQGWKIDALVERINKHPENGKRLFWLKGISDDYLDHVYQASTCLVAASINEGFGLPLIEAARHGIPVIARDIPVFREVAGDAAFYFSGDTGDQLSEAMDEWLLRHREGTTPSPVGMRWSTWEQSTEQLKVSLIERHYPRRQLLVDISEIVQRDARTGIQRVVRSILKEWLENPPENYRVEPVYASGSEPYRYARQFSAKFTGKVLDGLLDEPIDYAPGDCFFALDLQPQVQVSQRAFYQHLRQQQVKVQFLVYDLLCVRQPQYFPRGTYQPFVNWLEIVCENDGALCISKSVADELAYWAKEHAAPRKRPFQIDWFHLGADTENSCPTVGLPTDAGVTLGQLRDRTSFLMVGTLEPRKGHTEVLDAFERLWRAGTDANLVIVGKQGWMVEEFVARLRAHDEVGQRLFWLEGISDEYLEKVYAASTCLIVASHGEGFGLPLVEAAQHQLPIIARDIPVFREVAGGEAFYFDAETPEALASVVVEWLRLYNSGCHPKPISTRSITWKESARNLLDKLRT